MAQQTVKVDNAVHQRLEELKNKHSMDSFNDVLKKELGLIPEANSDKLIAYLPTEEMRDAAKDVIFTIEQIDQYETSVEKAGNRDKLRFISPETNSEIANIVFSETSFKINYRNQNGEMTQCGRAYRSSGTDADIHYGKTGNTYDSVDLDDVKQSIRQKVSGANRRWGLE